ncbi:probable methyltransferase-like protein 24 [Mercenaria mercenaria]|uniref:probable methyltransferase-like protein 24 n=1 Tax=Mercenaria mercenaria TaxID=6596 RepID=UPI00234F76C0|nr:probable methyltransferase-like protein 24 [Mercenaria mercenaria]XP_053405633.1 probable methyltransferase-like protein 24 [Mercenaria mercenaria]
MVLISKNSYPLAVVFTLVVLLAVYGYNKDIALTFWANVYKEKFNKCDKDIDEKQIYRLPADPVLDSMDDSSLYQTFWKYINTCQVSCKNLTRLGPPDDDKGKNVCADDIFKSKPSSCLVYSFGSNFNFKFEEAVWARYKCEIHTFDPSRALNGVTIPTGVNFHLIGLSGNNFVRSEPDNWRTLQKYNTKTWNMQTLSSIRKSLNHTNRIIDILKIDIEGWEWSTLPEIMGSGVLQYVKQICLEVHFGYGIKVFHHEKKSDTYEFTSEKWGNVQIPDQLKVLRNLFKSGFRIFKYDPITGWASRHVNNPSQDVNTLVEISLVNINWTLAVHR